MEIYRYLLDLLSLNHPSRMTILTACNRLANKCSIELEERYRPLKTLSSRDYPKATTQISAFDIDEALNLIATAENSLHRKQVSLNISSRERNSNVLFSCSLLRVNKRWKF